MWRLLLVTLSFVFFCEAAVANLSKSFDESCIFRDGSRIEFKQYYMLDKKDAETSEDKSLTIDLGYDVRFISSKGKQSEWLKVRDSENYGSFMTQSFDGTQALCSKLIVSPNERYCYEYYCLTEQLKWGSFRLETSLTMC